MSTGIKKISETFTLIFCLVSIFGTIVLQTYKSCYLLQFMTNLKGTNSKNKGPYAVTHRIMDVINFLYNINGDQFGLCVPEKKNPFTRSKP